ncbi:MAG TPA: GNAT family N-acetyltransferase [Solirubrobacteraceae bacterium]|nr:GNAT family N-acetyltransferase [Solirubrobacteraceae bacterium]
MSDCLVRVAGCGDTHALAGLRASWTGEVHADDEFEWRFATWIEAEGERRTTWLALLDDLPVGMASLFEYRRMPRPGRLDSRWGYISNMFVLEPYRARGIGTALLSAIISAADDRSYVRLVLSPSEGALSFYRRMGFVTPDERVRGDRLLVRPLTRTLEARR